MVCDQTFTRVNKAMHESCCKGYPVRVIRCQWSPIAISVFTLIHGGDGFVHQLIDQSDALERMDACTLNLQHPAAMSVLHGCGTGHVS